MPTAINRGHHHQLELEVRAFLESQGCTIAPGRYLPPGLGVSVPGAKMEAMLVSQVPRAVAADGIVGVRCISQGVRGSASDKICGIVEAMKKHWNIPGLLIARGTAGEDFNRWVRWAKSEVGKGKLLFVGDVDEFRNFFSQRIG